MSKRRFEAYKRAEEVCKAFRSVVTKRAIDQTQSDWNLVLTLVTRWMNISTKKINMQNLK